MKPRRHLIRIAAVLAACLGGTAFAGLSLAHSGTSASPAQARHAGQLCVRFDTDDPAAQCLRRGPRGRRGQTGQLGPIGLTGAVGPGGLQGPVGAVGPRGPIGAVGIQGIQGIQGPNGAFGATGSTPGNGVVTVLGSKIGPIPFASGPGTGTELTPTVARCPTSGPDKEAFDGGAIITTANPLVPGPTGDVVGLESSYPGLYAGPTEVDPLPLGGAPGAVSTQPANAYQAQAVITQMHSGDNVTVQAYVICGP